MNRLSGVNGSRESKLLHSIRKSTEVKRIWMRKQNRVYCRSNPEKKTVNPSHELNQSIRHKEEGVIRGQKPGERFEERRVKEVVPTTVEEEVEAIDGD